ncbi:MAG TPA: glycosyltransferase family 39 protein [Nitrospirota bacterium]|nr:glycosyltransferase family 39 protein [Nitrospirota bacterium]
MQNRLAVSLFVSCAFLLALVALFLGRASDDNSLFSWAWAFRNGASLVYLALVAGLCISFFSTRIALPANWYAPFLFTLSFVAVLPFWSEPELIVDASRYFTQAKHLEVYGLGFFLREWGRTIQAWTDSPLVPLLYGLLFKAFGEHRFVIQLFTTTLFSLTAVITYLIGKTLWNRETGFSAGLLLLGIPYLLTQVPLMLVDVPTMFFLTLAVFMFLDAAGRGGRVRITAAVAAIVLAALSKYSAWLMLSVLVVALAVFAVGGATLRDFRPARRGIVILLAAAALACLVLLFKSDIVIGQLALLRAYQKPGLDRWTESFRSTFLYQVHPFITLSALASVVVAARKRDIRFAVVCWLVLLVLALGIRRIRYILPLFPMLTLMAGYGLQLIRREELKRFIVFGTAAASLSVGYFAYLPLAGSMSVTNLKHAGGFLNTLDVPEVEVITLVSQDPVANPAVAVPLLDLFTDKHIVYHYVPDSFPAREDVERSSLRFTWEYRNPAYYSDERRALGAAPIVVISGTSNGPLPKTVSQRIEGRRLAQEFITDENIFQYTVGVRIYH